MSMELLKHLNPRNPIIYDNDVHSDTYTDELLLALSSAGEIQLKGFITTSPVNRYVNLETYELEYLGREEIIRKAGRSGLKNLPVHYRGPALTLQKPDSGIIEDTVSVDSPGSRFIVKEAMAATEENPLLLVMGGPLTAAADAWLLNPDIAEKLVVVWLGGSPEDMNDYNGWVDPWAAYIVIKKLKFIQFTLGVGRPSVTKEELANLPVNELTCWMVDKMLPHAYLPGDGDGDAQPVIGIMRKDYIRKAINVSFSHWVKGWHGADIPAYKEDACSNAVIVLDASADIATEEWWRVFTSIEWGQAASSPEVQRPFYAVPLPVGRVHRIEAEDFDHGGKGVAYFSQSSHSNATYRSCNFIIKPACDVPGGYNIGAGGGYCISGLLPGDWLEYTINIEEEKEAWTLDVRVASEGRGGSFHIEFDGEDRTGTVDIPDTKGELCWRTITAGNVHLKKGVTVMRFVADKAGEKGTLGNINYFRLW